MKTSDEIRAWLMAEVAKRQGPGGVPVDPREPFANYLIDSVEAVNLAADLQVWAGVELPETALWDFPTIESLVRHLAASREG